MSPGERRACFLLAGFVALITSVPYVLGYASEGDAWRFTGLVFGVEDGNSYLAKMLSGTQGEWLFRSPYTTFPQAGVAVFVPYLLLGKLVAGEAVHDQLVALYHLFRIAAIPLAVWATYRLASRLLAEPSWRLWATSLATLGGGLGWLLALTGRLNWQGSLPLDFISPESFGFLSFYGLPHLTAARGFLLLALVAYLDSLQAGRPAWRGGALILAAALFQPLTAVTGLVVIAAHQMVSLVRRLRSAAPAEWWREARSALALAVVPAPYLAYLSLRFATDPYLQRWTGQNLLPSPHPVHYVAAYAVLAPAVALGLPWLLRRGGEAGLLILVWIAALPVLAYAPHPVQRRLPEAIWVMLAVAGACGLAYGLRPGRLRRVAGASTLALCLPTSALLLAGGARAALNPSPPHFLPSEQVEIFLHDSLTDAAGAVVAAAIPTANALPAWAPVRVIVGHGPESVEFDERDQAIEAFYGRAMSDQARLMFLAQHGASYVFYGPDEAVLGGWDPAGVEWLKKVAEADGYALYRAQPAGVTREP